jgi:hypothetical protein
MTTWERRRFAVEHTTRWAAHNTRLWLGKPAGPPPTRGGLLLMLVAWLALVFEAPIDRLVASVPDWVAVLVVVGSVVAVCSTRIAREIWRARHRR